jgi:hypothetical protein
MKHGMGTSTSMYDYKSILVSSERKHASASSGSNFAASQQRMKNSISFPVNMSETLREQMEADEAVEYDGEKCGGRDEQMTASCESFAKMNYTLVSAKAKSCSLSKSKVCTLPY